MRVDKENKGSLGVWIRFFSPLFSAFRQCNVIPGFESSGFQQEEGLYSGIWALINMIY